jgi:hypothetical protein
VWVCGWEVVGGGGGGGVFAIIKNEIMPCVGKWMELEIAILSEITQVPKAKYLTFFNICRI